MKGAAGTHKSNQLSRRLPYRDLLCFKSRALPVVRRRLRCCQACQVRPARLGRCLPLLSLEGESTAHSATTTFPRGVAREEFSLPPSTSTSRIRKIYILCLTRIKYHLKQGRQCNAYSCITLLKQGGRSCTLRGDSAAFRCCW